jgi:hypothetical protein
VAMGQLPASSSFSEEQEQQQRRTPCNKYSTFTAGVTGRLIGGGGDNGETESNTSSLVSTWCRIIGIGMLLMFVIWGGWSDSGGGNGTSGFRLFSTPSPTSSPTQAPTLASPTSPPTHSPVAPSQPKPKVHGVVNCDCPTTCTQAALDSYPTLKRWSCRQRLQFLFDTYQTLEVDACKTAVQQGWCDNKCMPGVCQA